VTRDAQPDSTPSLADPEVFKHLTPFEAFLETMKLEKSDARTTEDISVANSHWMPSGRVFGGQVAAQSVIAALRTVPEGRPIHSMHGYFLRPGDIYKPITLSVARLHDGRSFSTRGVHAYQEGQPIWSMIASFQEVQDGLEHQAEMPSGMPDPESLPSEAPLVESAGEALQNFWIHRRPFAMRHVEPPMFVEPAPERSAKQHVWIKAMGQMPNDPVLHQAAIAYVSDYTILEPTLRRHGLAWIDGRLRMASLDHAVWWHRPARADEWLLYEHETMSASGGRSLNQGRFFDRDGNLVASITQEGMVRVKESA